MRIWICALLLVAGCASSAKQVVKPKHKAEAAYVEGLQNYANANYLEAQRIFSWW